MNKHSLFIHKNFWSIACLQLLGNIAYALPLFLNLIIVGFFLDIKSLDSLGFSMPILLLIIACAFSLSTGIQSTSSFFLGRNQKSYAAKSFNIGLLFSLIFIIVLSIFIIVFSKQVALILGTTLNTEIYFLTQELITILAFGAPVLMISQTLLLIVKLDGYKILPYIGIACLVLGCITSEIITIFVFNMGLPGIAYSIDFSLYLSAFIMCTYFFKKRITFTINFKLSKKNLSLLIMVIKNAIPNVISQISNMIAIWIITLLLVNFGNVSYVGSFTASVNLKIAQK